MKDAILIEIACRWEREATPPKVVPAIVSTNELLDETQRKLAREAKRECADALRTLVALLGDAV